MIGKKNVHFKIYLSIILLGVAVIPISILSTAYFVIANPSIEAMAEEYLENVVSFSVSEYTDFFSSQKRIGSYVSSSEDVFQVVTFKTSHSEKIVTKLLDDLFLTFPNILSLYISDLNGNVIVEDSFSSFLSGVPEDYEEKLICAESIPDLFAKKVDFTSSVITNMGIYPDEQETHYFSVVTAIKKDNEAIGLFIANVSCDAFSNLYKDMRLFTRGYLALYDSSGAQVFGGYPSLTNINNENLPQMRDFAKIFYQTNFVENPSGFIKYNVGKEKKTAFYKVSPESNWILFATVTDSDRFHYKMLVFLLSGIILLLTAVASLMCSFFILRRIMSTFKKYSDKLLKIRDGDFSIKFSTWEESLTCKFSSRFNNMIDTIAHRMEELEQRSFALDQSNERYQIITDYTREIIFEWNFETDEAEYSFTWWKKFGYDPVMKNIREEFYNGKNIHPDDLSVFRSWVSHVYKGSLNSKEEFRIKAIDDDYFWCRVRTVPIFGKDNQPVKLVGLIQDIDDSKKKENELIQRADYDSLSQLMNRAAFENRIMSLIVQKHRFALMYIDIDDFRRYNTNFGHEFGDRVIQFIGSKIASGLNNRGFAGRVGGDEFIICISSPEVLPFIESVAEQVSKELKAGLNVREQDSPVEVKCSIGIVFYPDHAETYEELSSIADRAMYDVKHNGKNSFIIAAKKKDV